MRRPDKQGRSGLQGFRKATLALTLKMISVFLMLAILDYSLISVSQVEAFPDLSKQNQLRALINMSAGWWYPIRLSRMKRVFQFRPLCWHSSLLGKCVLMHITAHNTLIINVLPDVRIPEWEERRLPRQCNSHKREVFIAGSSQGSRRASNAVVRGQRALGPSCYPIYKVCISG